MTALENARRTHQMMIDSRQAADDRRLIDAADNVLRSGQFAPGILEALRTERDERQERLDAYIAGHGVRTIAY